MLLFGWDIEIVRTHLELWNCRTREMSAKIVRHKILRSEIIWGLVTYLAIPLKGWLSLSSSLGVSEVAR